MVDINKRAVDLAVKNINLNNIKNASAFLAMAFQMSKKSLMLL